MALEFSNNPLNQRLTRAVFAMFGPEQSESSFSFWIKVTAFTNPIQNLFGIVNLVYAAQIASTGLVKINFFSNAGGVTAVSALSLATWYHIVGTGIRDGTDCTTRIYINSVFDATKDDTDALIVSSSAFDIGNANASPNTQGFNGLLDDLRTYSRVLSDQEILTIYTARGHDAITDGLIQRIQFMEQGVGLSPVGVGSVKDVSVRKQNFNPVGSPVYRLSELSKRRRYLS